KAMSGLFFVLLAGCIAAGLALYGLRNSPLRLALGTGLLLTAGWLSSSMLGDTIASGRNFYGARSVRDDGIRMTLMHGTTSHGYQFKNPERRAEPNLYY